MTVGRLRNEWATRMERFLVPGRTAGRLFPRARESTQAASSEALLVAAKRSGRVAKTACDIVLIC